MRVVKPPRLKQFWGVWPYFLAAVNGAGPSPARGGRVLPVASAAGDARRPSGRPAARRGSEYLPAPGRGRPGSVGCCQKRRPHPFWEATRGRERELRRWLSLVEDAEWKNPADVRRLFGARVDFVPVASGNTVAVFDIWGNHYRLIAGRPLRLPPRLRPAPCLTHREYDLNHWKREL